VNGTHALYEKSFGLAAGAARTEFISGAFIVVIALRNDVLSFERVFVPVHPMRALVVATISEESVSKDGWIVPLLISSAQEVVCV